MEQPQLLIDGEPPTGAMVAIVPHQPNKIALKKGESAEALHVTSKYLGKADEWTPEMQQQLLKQCESLAKITGPIPLYVEAVEMFGEQKDAVALQFSSPEATRVHQIVNEITPDVELKWPDYKPHLTLMYVAEGKQGPDMLELEEDWLHTVIVGTYLRVSFGADVTDFLLEGESALESITPDSPDDVPAEVVTAAADPARSSPDELTDAEIQQRRDAAQASADARRKQGSEQYSKLIKGADARARARTDLDFDRENDASIKTLQTKLREPLTKTDRAMAETALEIAMKDRRERKIVKAEASRKNSKDLALARQELAAASRVFDVDKMNAARARVEELEKEADDMGLADEIVKITKDDERQAAKEQAQAAAAKRKADADAVKQMRAAQAEQKRQEAQLTKFYRAVEANRKREEAAAKKSANERASFLKKVASEQKRTAKAAETKKKKTEKEAKSKKKANKWFGTNRES